jgi:hypothetical protein
MFNRNHLMPQRSVEPPDPPPTWLVTGQESRVYRVIRCIVANTLEEAETLFQQRQGEIETEDHLYTSVNLSEELQVEQIF